METAVATHTRTRLYIRPFLMFAWNEVKIKMNSASSWRGCCCPLMWCMNSNSSQNRVFFFFFGRSKHVNIRHWFRCGGGGARSLECESGRWTGLSEAKRECRREGWGYVWWLTSSPLLPNGYGWFWCGEEIYTERWDYLLAWVVSKIIFSQNSDDMSDLALVRGRAKCFYCYH